MTPLDVIDAARVLAEHEQMKSLIAGRGYAPAPRSEREATAGTGKPAAKQEQLALLD